jgi:hypothetical protein
MVNGFGGGVEGEVADSVRDVGDFGIDEDGLLYPEQVPIAPGRW